MRLDGKSPVAAVLVWAPYAPFRRDRLGRQGRGVGLYSVCITGKASKADIVVGVYYRSASQNDGTNLLVYKDLNPCSKSVVLVLPLYTLVKFSLPSYEPLLSV